MTKMTTIPDNYNNIRAEIVELLRAARSTAARNVNSIMTATYWEIGRRIVEQELKGEARANYGEQLLELLAKDLTQAVWPGVWEYQSLENACILPCLVRGADSFDTVERIRQVASLQQYKPSILKHLDSFYRLPFALVGLRSPTWRQAAGGASFL